MDESARDVTQRILDRHIIYGGSDNTNPAYTSSNKSLNYAQGGSIIRPEIDSVNIIPFKINYKDTVGLFGKENHFVKVLVNINKEYSFACFEEEGWECGKITEGDANIVNTYASAVIDNDKDLVSENSYDPAEMIDNQLSTKSNAYISVDLNNLKTGNKYIDSWFDVRLYTKDRKEHPYDIMYIRLTDFFYIGFHARNTKRLPYDVNCVIGQEYISGLNSEQERFANQA